MWEQPGASAQVKRSTGSANSYCARSWVHSSLKQQYAATVRWTTILGPNTAQVLEFPNKINTLLGLHRSFNVAWFFTFNLRIDNNVKLTWKAGNISLNRMANGKVCNIKLFVKFKVGKQLYTWLRNLICYIISTLCLIKYILYFCALLDDPLSVSIKRPAVYPLTLDNDIHWIKKTFG